jgi:hypothetical protein
MREFQNTPTPGGKRLAAGHAGRAVTPVLVHAGELLAHARNITLWQINTLYNFVVIVVMGAVFAAWR